jgi:hypothetical protein
MIKAAIVYWIALNFLIAVGGVAGWLQLRQSEHRVASRYLSRILLSEAMRGALSLWGTGRFRSGLAVTPLFMLASVVVITLVTGAIWGFLFYARGIINGGGWWGLLTRRWKTTAANHYINTDGGQTMEGKRKDEETANESPTTSPKKPRESGGGGGLSPANEPEPSPPDPGVGEGPGKKPDTP